MVTRLRLLRFDWKRLDGVILFFPRAAIAAYRFARLVLLSGCLPERFYFRAPLRAVPFAWLGQRQR